MTTSSSGVLESKGRNREVVDSIFRVGSLNVGTLTGKFLELVEGLKKRHVDAICVQETKWKGAETKEANGFKLWYSGVVTNRNGVDPSILKTSQSFLRLPSSTHHFKEEFGIWNGSEMEW
ncbi:hypothetical protein AgCh_016220 [Apium graveolens]